MPSHSLSGRTAIVTGGAVRLGRAIVDRLASAGAGVAIHCHSHREEGETFAEHLRSRGVRCCVVSGDLSRDDAPGRLLDEVAAELGAADLLVNSAAIFHSSTLTDLTREHWRRHLAINLEAPVFLSQEFARRLPDDQSGAIVNIVDWRALKPPTGHLAYTVAKAGLATVTRILAQELGPRIRVNAVAPGAILPAPGETEQQFQRLATRNPLQRTGSPADVSEAVLFLLSAPFVNGEILHVTGGEELM